MARTIRLNTAGGGAAASSSGLGQADVERIIDDRVRGTVVYEKEYTSSVPSGYVPLIPKSALNQDTDATYHCFIRGFGPNSGGTRMTIRFRKGTSSVPGSSNYTYWANYGTSGSSNGTGTNGNISGGSFEPSAWSYDSVASSGAQNMKEIIFHVNAKDSPTDGRNRVEMEYKVFVPANGGYQSYGSHSFHSFFLGNNGNDNWDNIEFGFGGAFYANSLASCNPVVQVYRQLRAPAS